MSSMRDFAKKENYLRQKTDLKAEVAGFVFLIFTGALLGLMLGYGLLFTGV